MMRNLLAAVSLLATLAFAACGSGSSSDVTPQRSGAASASAVAASPSPAAAISRDRLPVQLQIPGESGSESTSSVGSYLHVIDLSSGTAQELNSAPLADAPDAYMRPRLSPDGHRVAYLSSGSVAVIDVASGHEDRYQLAAGGQPIVCLGELIAWSPDSTRIAVNFNGSLVVVDTSTGQETELVPSGVRCEPAWSPDGRWIVFGGERSLVRVGPDGSGGFDGPVYADLFPTIFPALPRDFVWASDSSTFYFTADVLPGDGGNPQSLSFVSGLDLAAHAIRFPDSQSGGDASTIAFVRALSSSGTRAAYIRREHDAEFNWTMYVETRNLDGTDEKTLITAPDYGSSVADVPFWSPDDSFVAYPRRLEGTASGPGGAVYIVSSRSGEDVAAVLAPLTFQLAARQFVSCDVIPIGWLTPVKMVTWTTCEATP